MSEFSSYEKMPNNLKKLGLSSADFQQMDKLKWVVTEKVHGANFSFVYENGTLKYAKRKEYLQWTDDFFGFQLVVKSLETNVVRMFEKLAADLDGNKFILYGELFGGAYPHPAVKPVDEIQAIQTGVYYCPDIRFCAFDLAFETDGKDSKQYIDYETAISYFKEFGIFYAKPMLIGKLTEALNFNIRVNSAIPAELSLPLLEKNMIEGVVVKPFSKPETDLLSSRPIIKIKNPEFDEEDKYHEAEKWSFIPGVSSKTEDLSYIVDELRHYVTLNRLNSAVSKIGTFDNKNDERMAQIKAEILADVYTDFNENNHGFIDELDQESKQWVMDRVNSEISLLLKRQ